MLRRALTLVANLVLAAALIPSAFAALIHIRVEGKTQTIFGANEPFAIATTPLEALEAASLAGEFYYHVKLSAFGPYVEQIGRYPAGGANGWVFKVNGVLPSVGADKVQLKPGDRVLWYWATFTPSGAGSPTLELRRSGSRCYTARGQDDGGVFVAVPGIVYHVGTHTRTVPSGRLCLPRAHGPVWVSAPGAVRSNRLP